MRDNFSATAKRQLAERVAWQCSFPGCPAVTIGPKGNEEGGSLMLGEAAHIHAASPLGPRYDATMSAAQRIAAPNGIWMCRHHARLIDADVVAYSADTLSTWKQQAETKARNALIQGNSPLTHVQTTLVLISDDVIVEAVWISVSEKTWVFEILTFIEGNAERLRDIISAPADENAIPHFLVVETQGDGRVLYPGSVLKETSRGTLELYAEVAHPEMRITLAEVGSDIALDEDGDLSFADGDIGFVSGVD